MSRKFSIKSEDGKSLAKVKFNEEWDEYVVELCVEGSYIPEADYFTSDFQDACDTAKEMIKQ